MGWGVPGVSRDRGGGGNKGQQGPSGGCRGTGERKGGHGGGEGVSRTRGEEEAQV